VDILVRHGGTGSLIAVYPCAEPVMQQGRVRIDTPGFDRCSATGQIDAAGASRRPLPVSLGNWRVSGRNCARPWHRRAL
jgi:hypothetical protein